MATASDDFNRANGSLGANWTTAYTSGGEVSSNAARGNDATLSGSFYSAVSFAADHEAQITKGAGDYAGPAVRMSAVTGGTGYVYFNHGSVQRVDGGVNSVIGTWGTFGNGDVVRFRATGSTLEGWVNGVYQGAVVDATYATGQPGAAFYQAGTGYLDDWLATDQLSGGGTLGYLKTNKLRPRIFSPGLAR